MRHFNRRDIRRKILHEIIKGQYLGLDLFEQNGNFRKGVECVSVGKRDTAIIDEIAGTFQPILPGIPESASVRMRIAPNRVCEATGPAC
jgi:hypothetical protein